MSALGLNSTKARAASSLLLAMLLPTIGCENPDSNHSQKKAAEPKTKSARPSTQRQPLHRFVLTRISADVAFDTQTGQICRTWDWQPIQAAKPDPVTGTQPQTKLGQFAPTCLSLYNEFPSGTDDGLSPTPDTEGGAEGPTSPP